MTSRDMRDEDGGGRRGAMATGGYIGFGFGLLAVLSTASEVHSPTIGQAAVILLVCMLVGAAAGIALRPFVKTLL